MAESRNLSSATSYFTSEGAGDVYQAHTYSGVSGWVLRRSHALVERPFGPDERFSRVLEVGAGTGVHFSYVRHQFDQYVMTDGSSAMLEAARQRLPAPSGALTFELQDAGRLSFPDESFDRVIAAHTLEHLASPQIVLDEWRRVLRRGGVLSLVLPCDPGVMWRVGRALGPRAKAKKAGLEYDYVMALEHVNSIMGLRAIIRKKFRDHLTRELWWPFPFPSVDLNLIYAVNVWR